MAVLGKEYEIKFLYRTREELFVYPKIDDIVHVHEKDIEAIFYVNKQAKSMARLSDILRFCHLSKLFPQLIIK